MDIRLHRDVQIFEENPTYDPVAYPPLPGKPLYLYVVIAEESVHVILIRDSEFYQSPKYFVSKVLAGTDRWYPKIEKAALASVTTSQKLRRYFLSYFIIVHTDFL